MENLDFGKLSDFDFFDFEKLGYYYYSKKGGYNPPVVVDVVVVTVGFCAGLPGRREIIVNSLTNSGCGGGLPASLSQNPPSGPPASPAGDKSL